MVISIASQKGGTGKTTTSISLAAGLARRGKNVLVIDVDSQANSSKVLLPEYKNIKHQDTASARIVERKPLPVHPSPLPGLFVAPAHILLSDTDVRLTTAFDHREARLKDALDTHKSSYDHI